MWIIGLSDADVLLGCPRLKKLWLCQNQITTIDGLHGVPELEELWLQSNNISSLEGLDCCPVLQHLGLAGNNVSDFAEVRRLSNLKALTVVSFQDIHFGRCPVTDEEGYKEFVASHLMRVEVLDGVELTKEHVDDALISYAKEVSDNGCGMCVNVKMRIIGSLWCVWCI